MATAISNEVVVYRARNTVNGNSYVGVTRRGVGRREHEHRYAAAHGGQTRLHKALRKWGDKIQFEIIMDFQGDYELAMAFEAELVAKEKPAYNLVPGGLNRVGDIAPETTAKQRASHIGKPNPRKGVKMPPGYVGARAGVKHTEETRAKMKAAAKRRAKPSFAGKRHTEEAKAKMSAALKGKPGHWKGKKRPDIGAKISAALTGRVSPLRGVSSSPEAVEKMRAAKIGRPQPQTAAVIAARAVNFEKMRKAKCKPVMCLNDGNRFDSAAAAGEFYGVSGRQVAGVASGTRRQKSIKGLRFTYEVPLS